MIVNEKNMIFNSLSSGMSVNNVMNWAFRGPAGPDAGHSHGALNRWDPGVCSHTAINISTTIRISFRCNTNIDGPLRVDPNDV